MTKDAPALPPSPGPEVTAAVPALDQIREDLSKALLPAMKHSTPDGYAGIGWMMLKGLGFLIEAARAAQAGDPGALHDALREVDVDARAVAYRVRALRASLADAAELARLDAPGRTAGWGLGDADASVITATVHTANEWGELDDKSVELRIDLGGDLDDRDRGFPCPVAWRGDGELLPVDGRTHLDLVAIGEALGAVYDRHLRTLASQEEASL